MEKQTKKILVTGAAGFVGQHVVRSLVDSGYKVIALDKNKGNFGKLAKKIDVVTADLAVKGSWTRRVKSADVLIHLAAQISSRYPEDFDRNNTLATLNLLDSLKGSKLKKIILFSSAAVTSIRKDKYALTKMEQEKIVKKSGFKYVILRPSMMYGPKDDKNIGWIIKVIKKYPVIPLPGGGNFGRQPVFIGDICKIVLRLVEKNYPKPIYEIHGFEYVTMKQMVKEIRRALKQIKIMVYVPIATLLITFFVGERVMKDPKFTTDQIKSLVSGEKFKGDKWWKIFNVEPTPFRDGVAQML